MNHKRRRPKNRRAGCLSCKPHKGNGTKKMTSAQTLQERKAREWHEHVIRELTPLLQKVIDVRGGV